MATWAMRKRYEWITARLEAGEPFTRMDICDAFTVTKQTVSATVAQYDRLHPGAMRYDTARKAFVRGDALPLPSKADARRLAADGLAFAQAFLARIDISDLDDLDFGRGLAQSGLIERARAFIALATGTPS